MSTLLKILDTSSIFVYFILIITITLLYFICVDQLQDLGERHCDLREILKESNVHNKII